MIQSTERIYTDGLTGCPTCYRLRLDLGSALMDAARDKTKFNQSFVCVDIDNFMQFLDYNGHAEGDQVLRVIGQRLMDRYPSLTVYRYGGDEFVVVGATQWHATIAAGLPVQVKHTVLDAKLTAKVGRHHRATGWLILHIEAALIQSTVSGQRLICRNRSDD